MYSVHGYTTYLPDEIFLVYKTNDQQLRAVLQRMKARVTLNDKCEFSDRTIKLLRHIISKEDIQMILF